MEENTCVDPATVHVYTHTNTPANPHVPSHGCAWKLFYILKYELLLPSLRF